MKNTFLRSCARLLFVALLPIFSLSLVSCEPDDGVEDDAGISEGVEVGPEDTTFEIAVTGLVDKFGCTYADVSGYANLNLLPVASDNLVIGVEVVEAETNENAVSATTTSLTGNIFSVSFSNLSPATEYKYRSFVTCGGMTYYATKYNTFTTKEMMVTTCTGEVSDIKRKTVVVSASVQTEGVDSRDNIYVGFAWSTSASDLYADGNFKSTETSVQSIMDGVYSVLLSGLSEGTTYCYVSFTKVGDVYVFSSVKEFTTDKFELVAVDLGLTVKWANCNVGAESPEEYGDYFAWGEIVPKSSYRYDNSVTYGLSTSELKSRGIIGVDGNLTAEYDAATANWGGNWRMPTFDEMKELLNNCTWEWTTENGVYGCKVTGPNGNSIFLPAAGYHRSTSLDLAGSFGYYWSATSDSSSSSARSLYFASDYCDWLCCGCDCGQVVRPVSE